MISLSNFKGESRNSSLLPSNSDSGNCSPKSAMSSITATPTSQDTNKVNIEISDMKSLPSKNIRKANVFETDDVDEDSNESKCLLNEGDENGKPEDHLTEVDTDMNQATKNQVNHQDSQKLDNKKSNDRKVA